MFAADRQHLHHYLVRRGLSIGQATMASALVNLVCAGIGLMGWKLGIADWIMFAGFVAFFLAYHFYMAHIFRAPQKSPLAAKARPMASP